jgi:hypothetical protein
MYAIKAVYDGNSFKASEPIPVAGEYEVVITFTSPIKKTQEKILDFFGTWDDELAETVLDTMKERKNFSIGRTEP